MSDLDDLEEIVGGYTPMHPWHKTRMRLPACATGHEYTPENTYWRFKGKKPTRVCRACDRERRASRKQAPS